VTHYGQAETAVRGLRKSRQHHSLATAAGIKSNAVILDRDHDVIDTDLNRYLDAQFPTLRRPVAHDVADDLLEHQFNVVAGAGVAHNFRAIGGPAIERAAQVREALFETARRPGKAEPNRVRVDAFDP